MSGTQSFWQDFATERAAGPVFRDRYTVCVGARLLDLPIRPLPDGVHAVASFLANHAAFAVLDAITDAMGARARALAPDIVVGLPTLGLGLAPAVARACGHARFVPLGTSRKFWYDAGLSEPIASITSPDAGKRLYLDPNLRGLLEGRRVLVVDDAVSTGRSIAAALALLARIGVVPVAVSCAMAQTQRWAEQVRLPVQAVFETPLFARAGNGWVVAAESP
ncbi:phosphoribosyltransferase [Nguyenibacter vanlangensis]|uniref:Phosphoribosyltransferase n=1 Tax=Nguyenibacter vanlangensis TaxID=1216886 RepID=A0ABZ3D4E4_9PROT